MVPFRFYRPKFDAQYGQTSCPRIVQQRQNLSGSTFQDQPFRINLVGILPLRLHGGLEILRTSRQIYSEISVMMPRLYDRDLCFCIKSTVQTSAPEHFLLIRDLPFLRMEELAYLDFSKFENICFEISNPNTRTETDIFKPQIWSIVSRIREAQNRGKWIYRALSVSISESIMQNLSIAFVENEPSEQLDKVSAATDFSAEPYWPYVHFRRTLQLFGHLRQVDCLRIHLPLNYGSRDLFPGETDLEIERIEAVTKLAYPIVWWGTCFRGFRWIQQY